MPAAMNKKTQSRARDRDDPGVPFGFEIMGAPEPLLYPNRRNLSTLRAFMSLTGPFASPRPSVAPHQAGYSVGLGTGVGRGLGVIAGLAVGVGRGVFVGVTEGIGVDSRRWGIVGVILGVGVGVGVNRRCGSWCRSYRASWPSRRCRRWRPSRHGKSIHFIVTGDVDASADCNAGGAI